MSEDVNGNGSAESYAEAVRQAGGVWTNNGNGTVEPCVLDAGVAAIGQQLAAMRAAQAAQSRFKLEQVRIHLEQQAARASLDTSRVALAESLKSGDHEGVADSICALVEATARWYRAGAR